MPLLLFQTIFFLWFLAFLELQAALTTFKKHHKLENIWFVYFTLIHYNQTHNKTAHLQQHLHIDE